jgi:IS30 family transposase
MARFSDRMVPEVVQVFWAAMAGGEFVTVAAAEVGTYREKGTRWLAAEGGIRPRRGRDLKGRCLTFSQREEIAAAGAGGESMRAIARRLGRRPSTVSRELARNRDRAGEYRATTAHARAYERASRPQPATLHTNVKLRRQVQGRSQTALLPRADRRPVAPPIPYDPEMRVSARTIYQSLYVQARGALRRDLTRCLRTGRALRRPRRRPGQRRNQIPDMINIG